MRKKYYVMTALALLILGLIVLVASYFGLVSADATGGPEVGAIKALLVFGGGMITLSVVLFALFTGL